MEFDSGAGELFVCLDEIAGIGPQADVILCHDNVAGLAGKAARPFDLFPARSGIFTAMGIGAGDDHGIVAEFADLRDTRRKNIINCCHNMQI